MPENKITDRISSSGPQNVDEQRRLQELREKAMEEFPPSASPRLQPVSSGIGFQIRTARESRGLTWYALAEKAGLPNAGIVRDIECGREVTLSHIEVVASALGLKLELVEQAS
jgi:ribosome-binding protein aMBF1 (putative translation factor)